MLTTIHFVHLLICYFLSIISFLIFFSLLCNHFTLCFKINLFKNKSLYPRPMNIANAFFEDHQGGSAWFSGAILLQRAGTATEKLRFLAPDRRHFLVKNTWSVLIQLNLSGQDSLHHFSSYQFLEQEVVHGEEKNEPHFFGLHSAAEDPTYAHYQLQGVLKNRKQF